MYIIGALNSPKKVNGMKKETIRSHTTNVTVILNE